LPNASSFAATQELLRHWTRGWALARGLPAPLPWQDGFYTRVDWPAQQARYVFAHTGGGFLQLAQTLHQSWVFLKVCAAPETVASLLPPRWELQPPGYLMQCTIPSAPVATLPQSFSLATEIQAGALIARILAPDGTEAAIGRMVTSDAYAIYDRISTHPAYRRLGLASFIMHTLQQAAQQKNAAHGLLVATPEGKRLYERLGWTLLSPYTSAVIPGTDTLSVLNHG
jgi:GNAT superfamily N-acetyltransferase